jgi:tyrosyl-tRNA synthetase
MQTEVASGALHPMQAKKNLAHTITRDFHSQAEADSAAENWSLQFQRGGLSRDLEIVEIPLESLAPRWEEPINDRRQAVVRLSKLLVASGLAESNNDGERKIKAGAAKPDDSVQIQGKDRGVIEVVLFGGEEFSIRVGKRAKKIKIC